VARLYAAHRGRGAPLARAGLSRAETVTLSRRTFRRHLRVFVIGALALVGLDWADGGSWWSFWPLAAWTLALVVHYFVHKARTVDEAWADERVEDLRSKSYDASHIDTIKKDATDKPH
jgi:hypothetical protein